jgi:hypothetical protein
LTYHSEDAGFSLQVPSDWRQQELGGPGATFYRDVPPGTTLGEETMMITVAGEATCPDGDFGDFITADGIPFRGEERADAGAGSVFEWLTYTTVHAGNCVRIEFFMRSSNPQMYDSPPVEFDREAERASFEAIISTFRFEPQGDGLPKSPGIRISAQPHNPGHEGARWTSPFAKPSLRIYQNASTYSRNR